MEKRNGRKEGGSSSVGRTSLLHREGREFDSHVLHYFYILWSLIPALILYKTGRSQIRPLVQSEISFPYLRSAFSRGQSLNIILDVIYEKIGLIYDKGKIRNRDKSKTVLSEMWRKSSVAQLVECLAVN